MVATQSETVWGVSPTLGGAKTPSAQMESAFKDPMADEPRWEAWKVTVVVVVFCAAFWSGVGYLAVRLLG